MSLTLAQFNDLPQQAAIEQLLTCCTSSSWANKLVSARPFADFDTLLASSNAIWNDVKTDEANLLEAFDGHPQIGNVASLKEKYRNTQSSAVHEQSGANDAGDDILEALAKGNRDYLDKFGFIFIVFATGKSAEQMLDLLLARLPNDHDVELTNAAAEQNKITRLRLKNLLGNT